MVGPTPVFRLLTVIIMIAFLYQDLNSQLHHRTTYHKKAVNIVAIIHLKSCRNVVRVKRVSDNGAALSVSQTMGNIQHIMEVINSSTVRETSGELFGDGRILGGGWHLGTVFRLRFEQRTNQTNTDEKLHEPICVTKSV